MKRHNGRFAKTLDGEKRSTCLLLRTSTISNLRAMAESKGLSMAETVDLLIQGVSESVHGPQQPTNIGTPSQATSEKPKYAI